MTTSTDHADVRFPPPLVFLGFVLLGPVIDRAIGLAGFAGGWLVGAPLIALGALPIGMALGLFRRSGQDPAPWATTPSIVETGIYARTRNPMYLGMAMIALGLALGLGSIAAVALSAVAIVVIDRGVIRGEEAYLTAKFGESYIAYRARVRRWL